MNEFLEQFLIESRELVEQGVADLLALEQRPDDRERLDSAFRAFHTLKGAAGIIEFPAMGRLLHAAEDVLAAVRAGDRPVTIDLISHCLTCLDQVVRWLDAMQESGETPADADTDTAADRVAARFAVDEGEGAIVATESGGPPPWAEALRAAYPNTKAVTALRYTPDPACFFRGEDPLAIVAKIPGLLELRLSAAEAWAGLQNFDPFTCNLVIEALLEVGPDAVAACLVTVSDQVRTHALPSIETGLLSERARAVLQAQLDLALESVGEGFVGRLGSAGRVTIQILEQAGMDTARIAAAIALGLSTTDPSAFVEILASVLAPSSDDAGDIPTVEVAVPSHQDTAARALRVDVERIDAIIKLTGELTVVTNALGHAARLARNGEDAPALAQTLKDQHGLLERLTVELQRSVVAIRVLPLRHVFQRFSRLVREMTVTLGKSARLVVEGETTEADKAVVEALFEPLLHVVRNALDHGVEDRATRLAAGKPETALVRLRGYREGERVIVEIDDDGRGIDPARIRATASERGLIGADALAAISDEDVIELIFAPGFSLAGAVTDLSGRGVGMDAVRSTVERLGGRVLLRSRTGEGTSIRFILPFTVMMTRVMTVEASGQVFGVPFEAVVETLLIPRGEISRIGAVDALVVRGRTVPLINLGRTLGLPSAGDRQPMVKVVVIAGGGHLSALEVDAFGERLDVMLRPMEGLLTGMRGLAGTTLMGDGRVLIVLDLLELLQ